MPNDNENQNILKKRRLKGQYIFLWFLLLTFDTDILYQITCALIAIFLKLNKYRNLRYIALVLTQAFVSKLRQNQITKQIGQAPQPVHVRSDVLNTQGYTGISRVGQLID